MEKLLQQSEIDAMVRTARGGVKPQEVIVSRFDYRESGMAREQLEALSALHEGFARNLTNSIGAYLRTGFQAGLASAEHVSYREFVGGVPDKSYLGSVKIEPIGAAALIQMDMALAFPLIDVLLGGEGAGEVPAREITEIEEQILETIMRLICRELQSVWQALDAQFLFEQRQQPGRIQHLLPVEEKTLGLSFELSMNNCRGLMSIAVPAVVSGALLRKISSGRPRSQAQMRSNEAADRLRRGVLDCPFRLDLQLNLLTSSAREVAELAPGQVLVLRQRADGMAELVSQERSIFQARIARMGNRRAAHMIAASNHAGREEHDGKLN